MGTAPIAVGRSVSNPSPRMLTAGRITTVTNAESILTLTSATTPVGGEVTGNVQLSARSASLPWLSQIGATFSKFRVRSMSLSYEPYCPTTTSGQICLALVYDENDTAGPTAAAILQTSGNVRNPVWQKGSPVRYDAARAAYPWYYSKVNPVSTTLANLSVPAWLIYSAFSSTPTLGLGRIMCNYTIDFCDPVAPGINL